MNLNNVIKAVAIKKLANVDLPDHNSNQHELNGVAALRSFFETDQKTIHKIKWSFFKNESEVITYTSDITFYDAREKSKDRTGRTEWRLYYKGNILSTAEPGDLIYLVKTCDDKLYGLIFPLGSSWLKAAENLFGNIAYRTTFNLFSEEQISHRDLGYFEKTILDELGIEVQYPFLPGIDSYIDRAITLANAKNQDFPNTGEMAALAREIFLNSERINCRELPDFALLTLLDKETELFRALEKKNIEEKLKIGSVNVDEFADFALSILNRRKSRMGLSLQNHLEYIFSENELKFDTQKTTENKNKPDFIFPNINSYHDPLFPTSSLRMLAAKSTCKERWRQILTEANRISTKHLCTLDYSISPDTFAEMKRQSIVLVLPEKIRCTYSQDIVDETENIQIFIAEIKQIQNSAVNN